MTVSLCLYVAADIVISSLLLLSAAAYWHLVVSEKHIAPAARRRYASHRWQFNPKTAADLHPAMRTPLVASSGRFFSKLAVKRVFGHASVPIA